MYGYPLPANVPGYCTSGVPNKALDDRLKGKILKKTIFKKAITH